LQWIYGAFIFFIFYFLYFVLGGVDYVVTGA
jgi:hypothetical protein